MCQVLKLKCPLILGTMCPILQVSKQVQRVTPPRSRRWNLRPVNFEACDCPLTELRIAWSSLKSLEAGWRWCWRCWEDQPPPVTASSGQLRHQGGNMSPGAIKGHQGQLVPSSLPASEPRQECPTFPSSQIKNIHFSNIAAETT